MFNSSFIEYDEYISGYKFSTMRMPPSVFFMKIEEVPNFIINNRSSLDEFTIVTHQGDLPVTEQLVNFVSTQSRLKQWYGQNIEYKHPNVTSIPIGLENDCHFVHMAKRKRIYDASKSSFGIAPNKMAYMNFSFWTRRDERIHLRNVLDKKSFVTNECSDSVIQENYPLWIDRVMNHHYVLCPRGNGVDTHRLWETLYLGRIPIVKREINTHFYTDLPILFVDSWDEVTESLLNDNLERLSDSKNFNLEMLKFSYWEKKIYGGI